MTLGLIGEGKMWSPKTGISDAKTILDEYLLEPIHLDAGEGVDEHDSPGEDAGSDDVPPGEGDEHKVYPR